MSVSLVDQFWRYHGLHLIGGAALGALSLILARSPKSRQSSLDVALLGLFSSSLALRTLSIEAGGLGIALLAISARRRPGACLVLPMACVSSVGVWLAVPDTEFPITLVGLLLVYWMGSQLIRMPPLGRLAPMLALLVAAVVGSAGLPALVGGVGCLGVLPFLTTSPPTSGRRRALLAIHATATAVSSRIVTSVGWTEAIQAQLVISALCLVAYLVAISDGSGRGASNKDCPGDVS